MRTWTSLIAALILALGLLAAPEASAQANTHVVRAGETLFSIARQHGTTVAEIRRLNNLTGDTIRTGQRLVVRGAAAPARPAPAPAPAAPPPAPPPQQPEEPALRPADPLPPGPRPRYDTGESLAAPPPDLVRPDPIPTGPPPPPPPPATLTRVAIGAGGLQPFPNEPVAAAGGGGVHVVASGETLFALAQQYGTTVEAIRQANTLAGDGLAVGQRLVIPGGGAPAPAAAAAPSGRYVVTRSTVADDEVHAVLPGETLFSVAARYGTTVGRLLMLNALQTGPLAPGTMLVLPDGVGRQHHRQPAEPRVDEEGLALVYPASYAGRPTISGEPYDATALTASHRTLPFGTMLLVTAPGTGRRTLVRVNDRGPVSEGFLIELSAAAAGALGLEGGSAQRVAVQVLR